MFRERERERELGHLHWATVLGCLQLIHPRIEWLGKTLRGGDFWAATNELHEHMALVTNQKCCKQTITVQPAFPKDVPSFLFWNISFGTMLSCVVYVICHIVFYSCLLIVEICILYAVLTVAGFGRQKWLPNGFWWLKRWFSSCTNHFL